MVDRAALAAAPRLKIVQKFGTIGSNIDQAACAERGVAVAFLHRHVNVAVAEQCFALMLALAKRICALDGLVERTRSRPPAMRSGRARPAIIGYSNFARVAGLKTLFGATLGIVGLGEVGREIARRAAAVRHDDALFPAPPACRGRRAALAARHAPLADLMAQSDYIVVQLPLNDSTRGIIGADGAARRQARRLPDQLRARRAGRSRRRWSRRSIAAASAASRSTSATTSRRGRTIRC